jgi:hypothetical protein
MNWRAHLFWILTVAAWPLAAAPSVETNTPPARSVFTLPSNPSEGRDPFFPNSTRVYELVAASRPVELTSLKVKGFSEIGGRRYVIINNHTFGPGDEGDVTTPEGRIHIKCLEVLDNSVIVESGGVRHELKFSDQP